MRPAIILLTACLGTFLVAIEWRTERNWIGLVTLMLFFVLTLDHALLRLGRFKRLFAGNDPAAATRGFYGICLLIFSFGGLTAMQDPFLNDVVRYMLAFACWASAVYAIQILHEISASPSNGGSSKD
jgi:hypothetical protein